MITCRISAANDHVQSIIIEKIVDEVIAKHQKEVERFRAGEEKLLGFFVGQAMKAMKGKANPQVLNELLRKKLSKG